MTRVTANAVRASFSGYRERMGRRFRIVMFALVLMLGAGCSGNTPPMPLSTRPVPSGTAQSGTAQSSAAQSSIAQSDTVQSSTALPPPSPSPSSPSPSPVNVTTTATTTATVTSRTTATAPPAPPVQTVPTTPAVQTMSNRATPLTTDRLAPTLPDVGLAGVNVANCRSSTRPVVLLHGSFSTVASNFTALVPALRASGRCVYALNYGNGGVGSITSSASQFADLVAKVRSATGFRTVDVVGYSQGGLLIRTAMRFNGLADQISTAVLLAPSWNGTTAPLVASVPANLCPACADQAAGSALLRRLASGGDLDGNVRYAVVTTRSDSVVTPMSSQVPAGPPSRVSALVVQDRCPQSVVDHVNLPAQSGVVSWVVAALDNNGRPLPDALSC